MNRRIHLFLYSLLFPAVLFGVPVLLTWRAVRQEKSNRALITAITRQQIHQVASLLQAGADANSEDLPEVPRSWWRLLLNEFRDSCPPHEQALTALLLAMGVRANNDPNEGGFVFTIEDNPRIARLLIERGADVNVQAEGITPLSLAVLYHTELIPLLLDKGAGVNAPKNGDTPLFKAVRSNNPAVIDLLLKRGADINAVNDADLTPLMTAAGHIKDIPSPATVRALLKHHPDLDFRDKDGETALSTAKEYGTPEIVTLLKQAGAKE
jgi:ankyrin repeat protein